MKNLNISRIHSFREQINSSLLQEITGDYALLDVPNHGNIGDNLIWEGEVCFLNKINWKCRYSANVFNWEEKRINDIDVILFHGGGNWGDLYRVCQDHRLYVISKYTNKKIIVFPQTAWYNNESLLISDCKIVNRHPNIIVCLRDKPSYDMLSKYIDKRKLRLLPDMAFFVDIYFKDVMPLRTLFLNRTDTEQKELNSIPEEFEVSDWPTYPNDERIYRIWHFIFDVKNILSMKFQKCFITSCLVDPQYGLNRRHGRERYLKKGVMFFSKYNKIYTTRLHGLILGVLMGREVYIIDNKYNKCKNFYDTWLKEFDGIHIV